MNKYFVPANASEFFYFFDIVKVSLAKYTIKTIWVAEIITFELVIF
jgi:hypothetical protein